MFYNCKIFIIYRSYSDVCKGKYVFYVWFDPAYHSMKWPIRHQRKIGKNAMLVLYEFYRVSYPLILVFTTVGISICYLGIGYVICSRNQIQTRTKWSIWLATLWSSKVTFILWEQHFWWMSFCVVRNI